MYFARISDKRRKILDWRFGHGWLSFYFVGVVDVHWYRYSGRGRFPWQPAICVQDKNIWYQHGLQRQFAMFREAYRKLLPFCIFRTDSTTLYDNFTQIANDSSPKEFRYDVRLNVHNNCNCNTTWALLKFLIPCSKGIIYILLFFYLWKIKLD